MSGKEVRPDAAVTKLNRLFTRALLLAAKAGEAEPACRLAAAGWSVLRHDHPREAERLNGALHALALHLPPDQPSTGACHVRSQSS